MKGHLMTATSVTTLKKNIVFTLLCCTVLMMFVAGSTAAWAQSCPTSPNYTSGFHVRTRDCLTLNGNGDAGYPGFFPAVPPPRPTGGNDGAAGYPKSDLYGGVCLVQHSAAGFRRFFHHLYVSAQRRHRYGSGPADGIAFVIQNSPAGTSALGPDGCGIGFGDGHCLHRSATGGSPTAWRWSSTPTRTTVSTPTTTMLRFKTARDWCEQHRLSVARIADNFNSILPTPDHPGGRKRPYGDDYLLRPCHHDCWM